MGAAPRQAAGSGKHVGKVESPGHLHRDHREEERPDLQDSASSWETGTGVTGNEPRMTFLRNLAEGFHTCRHQQV